MGRPKGSKNQPQALAETLAIAAAMTGTQVSVVAREMMASPPAKPDFITITLTDEDLAPARQAKAAHAKAAARHIQAEVASEARRKDSGEIEELSVPQVVAFDLSAAFTKIAQQKARTAGYRFAHALRKTPEGWVFDASNSPKVAHVPEADQS